MVTFTELIQNCLNEVERKYGTGQQDGEFPLALHNRLHTELVIADALRIADLAIEHNEITPRQKELLHVAAAFHDIERRSTDGRNELISADIMDSFVAPTELFSTDELLEIREIIMGTEIAVKHGVPSQVFAQSYLAKILADADLAALGKPLRDYQAHEKALFTEQFPALNSESRKAFLSESLELLKNHRYFTREAEYLFQDQEINLAYVKEELQNLP